MWKPDSLDPFIRDIRPIYCFILLKHLVAINLYCKKTRLIIGIVTCGEDNPFSSQQSEAQRHGIRGNRACRISSRCATNLWLCSNFDFRLTILTRRHLPVTRSWATTTLIDPQQSITNAATVKADSPSIQLDINMTLDGGRQLQPP